MIYDIIGTHTCLYHGILLTSYTYILKIILIHNCLCFMIFRRVYHGDIYNFSVRFFFSCTRLTSPFNSIDVKFAGNSHSIDSQHGCDDQTFRDGIII